MERPAARFANGAQAKGDCFWSGLAKSCSIFHARKAKALGAMDALGYPQDEGFAVYYLPTSFNDPSCEAGKEI